MTKLTDRELEVLAYIGMGYRQKEIAEKLHRSHSTVNRHRESIGEKLGIADRAELFRLAEMAALEIEDISRKRMILNPSAVTFDPANKGSVKAMEAYKLQQQQK